MSRPDDNGADRLFKVSVDLPEVSATWPPFSTERIFVQKTAVKSEGQVKSIPFFARGISYDDIIHVGIDRVREELMFESVVRESGHSTVRILLEDERSAPRASALLTEYNCDWEVTTVENHWAVDIPPTTPYAALRSNLSQLESAGILEFEEGAISSVHHRQLT